MFAVPGDKVLETDEFLRLCKEAESDQEKAREMTKVSLDDRPPSIRVC